MYSETFLKYFIKLLMIPFSVMFQSFFTQKTLKGSSKYTWALNVLRHAIP